MDIKKIQPLLRAKGVPVSDDDFIFDLLSLYEVAFEDIFEGKLENVIKQLAALKGVETRQFNIKRMQAVLLARGIRIGDDDPIFTMLGLNNIVLENMANVYQQRLKSEHVQRLSIESVKREKHIIYATCIAIAIAAFFGGQKIEWLRQSLIGIGGIALGAMLCFIFFEKKILNNTESVRSANSASVPSVMSADSADWTTAEFHHVAMMAKLSKRTVEACRDVLIGGIDLDTAAAKQKMEKSQLQRGLKELNNNR